MAGMNGPYETGRFADVSEEDGETRADLVGLIREMAEDLRAHPEEWENNTLQRHLDTLCRCLGSFDALYRNRGEELPDQPTWKMVAELLVGTTGYE